jgi:hypothetical protein
VIPPSTSKNPVLLNVEDVFGDEVHELSLVWSRSFIILNSRSRPDLCLLTWVLSTSVLSAASLFWFEVFLISCLI